MHPKSFTILGAGICGLSTAIALKKMGIRASVFEAAPAFKPVGAGLLLAANAIAVYQKLDIADKIIPRGRRLPAFSIKSASGQELSHADAGKIGAKYGLHNFSIHRADLHDALLQELSDTPLHVSKRATHFTQEAGKCIVHFQDGSTHETDYLLASDGIHSAIRQQLLPDAAIRYAGYTCWRGVLDAGDIRQDFASETWGRKGRFGIVPLPDNRIYWFACVNATKPNSDLKHHKIADLISIFKDFHAPIPEILEQSKPENLIWNDIIDLSPQPHFAFGNALLLGDAAHATTPNLGQGACQAIEDAIILADEISKNQTDIPAAFRSFETRRIRRVHSIVNNSWTLGKMAQWSNPVLAAARNTLLRLTPESMSERQMKSLLTTDF